MKRIIILLIIILFFSCRQLKDSVPLSDIVINNHLDTLKIRFDGFYNVVDNSIFQIEGCEDLLKEKQTNFKTKDEIEFRNKKDKLRDSIIFAVKLKNCEENGKRYRDVFTSIRFVVFNKNKGVYQNSGNNKDDSPYKCSYYKMIANWHKEHKKEIFGNFLIKKDSIYAYLPITLNTWGMIPRTVKCNYRGYIKNKDTITDWRVVPPYPRGISNFIFENNLDLFNSQTLYFVKTEAVKCLKMD
jgi:hypothetical protein